MKRIHSIIEGKFKGAKNENDDYTLKENEIVVTFTQQEIDAQAEQEAQNVINKQKAEQHAELSKTDWYVIRQLETGVDIPENILFERQAIRDKYNN